MLHVAARRPCEQSARVNQVSLRTAVLSRDEYPVRQVIQYRRVGSIRAVGGQTLGVQGGIHLLGPGSLRAATCRLRRFPGAAIIEEPSLAPFGARAVPRRERCRFIEEEKFGVAVRRHHRPFPTPELQYADEI